MLCRNFGLANVDLSQALNRGQILLPSLSGVSVIPPDNEIRRWSKSGEYILNKCDKSDAKAMMTDYTRMQMSGQLCPQVLQHFQLSTTDWNTRKQALPSKRGDQETAQKWQANAQKP
jgi:hypothetical protein